MRSIACLCLAFVLSAQAAPLPRERWHVQPGEWSYALGTGGEVPVWQATFHSNGQLSGADEQYWFEGTWRTEGWMLYVHVGARHCETGEATVPREYEVIMYDLTANEIRGRSPTHGFPLPILMKRKG